jgi:hypothetical protein
MCFDKRVVEFLSFCEPLEACPDNIVFNTAVLTKKSNCSLYRQMSVLF